MDEKIFHIYTSFVSSIDGKVFVKQPGFWPIGSREDYRRFTELRARADIIIDGKNTALAFGDRTIETIHSAPFRQLRKDLRKEKEIVYAVLTQHPSEDLAEKFKNPYGFKPLLITSASSAVTDSLQTSSEVARVDPYDLINIVQELVQKGLKKIFIDGGPQLITSLIKANLLDEIFLTIAPKVFGNKQGITMTMAEGELLTPESIRKWHLQSVERVEDEVFLHYAKP